MSKVVGFTPYAKENLLTKSGTFRSSQINREFVFLMGGRDDEGRRLRRQLKVTLYVAWIDYNGRRGMTHLWTVRDGRRRLIHRKDE